MCLVDFVSNSVNENENDIDVDVTVNVKVNVDAMMFNVSTLERDFVESHLIFIRAQILIRRVVLLSLVPFNPI